MFSSVKTAKDMETEGDERGGFPLLLESRWRQTRGEEGFALLRLRQRQTRGLPSSWDRDGDKRGLWGSPSSWNRKGDKWGGARASLASKRRAQPSWHQDRRDRERRGSAVLLGSRWRQTSGEKGFSPPPGIETETNKGRRLDTTGISKVCISLALASKRRA